MKQTVLGHEIDIDLADEDVATDVIVIARIQRAEDSMEGISIGMNDRASILVQIGMLRTALNQVEFAMLDTRED